MAKNGYYFKNYVVLDTLPYCSKFLQYNRQGTNEEMYNNGKQNKFTQRK